MTILILRSFRAMQTQLQAQLKSKGENRAQGKEYNSGKNQYGRNVFR